MLELKNISKTYGSKKVLRDISLNIATGQTVSLIGPSGCGKSTLLRIMVGLVAPDRGLVNYDGNRLSSDNVNEIRHNIGYVIQEGGLFPHLSAGKNVTLAAEFLNESAREIRSRVHELAGLVNIEESLLSRQPEYLSGGQRQRISLMRALMLDPDFLLLDEPLGSIDPLVRYELQKDLKSIFSELNKTVVLVTHDLGEAAYLGDVIVLMKEGEIAQKGSIDEIMKNPASQFVEDFITAQRSPLEELK